MTEHDARSEDPIDPTGESLSDWRAVWEEDRQFPISSRPGLLGRFIVLAKRALRGFVRAPQADLWERQRAYNLVLQERLEEARVLADRLQVLDDRLGGTSEVLEGSVSRLGQDLQQVQGELVGDLDNLSRSLSTSLNESVTELNESLMEFLRSHAKRLDHLEQFHNRGYDEVMEHTAGLFSQLDVKLDKYRELSRERWGRLGGLVAVAESGSPGELAGAVADEKYLEFEDRFRGEEEDISVRLEPYLETLAKRSRVLDLGCGRGEALEIMSASGIECFGVDSNREMVERCRQKGLEATAGDLFETLERTTEASLGGVVSFHVIEHLSAPDLDRLIRLAWRALEPGGVLILETPNPTSLVVGASRFWIDPTHKRPVHPESLRTLLELNGFDPVERINLQAFAGEDRLPDFSLEGLPADVVPLVERLNDLRDRLDDLLFGFQDYGLIGHKPGPI